MDLRLNGKRALVMGASCGLGGAIAQARAALPAADHDRFSAARLDLADIASVEVAVDA